MHNNSSIGSFLPSVIVQGGFFWPADEALMISAFGLQRLIGLTDKLIRVSQVFGDYDSHFSLAFRRAILRAFIEKCRRLSWLPAAEELRESQHSDGINCREITLSITMESSVG